MNFVLHPARILRVMLGIIAVLAVLHIGQVVALFAVGDIERFSGVRMFDFDYEKNLPSLYSSLAIFVCAVLLWFISALKRKAGEPFKYHWTLLAIIFTYLGVDEALALHEEVGDFFEDRELVDASGFLYFAWVVPYAFLVLAVGLAYLKFLLALPRQTMILFVVSGGLFVAGAMGIEVFSAREADLYGFDTVAYHVLYTLEELCEMGGIALFCYALLRYIQHAYGSVSIALR